MKYFKNIRSIAEADALYRKLAKQFHPDRGGDTEIMQDINEEYEQVISMLTNIITVAETTNIKVSKDKRKIKLTKETEIGLKKHGAGLAQNIFSALFENLSDKYVERI